MKIGLETYIERSRSGNGGHVWLFFTSPCPCHFSRSIGLAIVKKVLQLSEFDKEISFDRLFPSQDEITENGLGNLIALPFQGKSVQENNTVFIDSETGLPYVDQYEFLKNMKRYSEKELSAAYEKLFKSTAQLTHKGCLKIIVNQNISIKKSALPKVLISFIKEELNFLNTEYLTKKRLGKSLYQVQKYFRLVEEDRTHVFLPRGFLSRLTIFLDENKIKYDIRFEPIALPDIKFKSKIKLSAIQEQIVTGAKKATQGVIVAPPGSGKTMMGLELIARLGKPALILVHRQELLNQWTDRISTYLGIPKTKIGRYAGNKKVIGKQITVGLLQSFSRAKSPGDFLGKFGVVIVDECHHIPAKTFRDVISNLNPEKIYGLTATPKRKFNDEKLIYVYIGEILYDMSKMTTDKPKPANIELLIKETDLSIPFDAQTDAPDLINKTICYDTARNKMITGDILEQAAAGRRILVLSERKEHLKILDLYLKGKCETLMLTGDNSIASRKIKLQQLEAGHYQVFLATGQLIGEGVQTKNIETLILTFPFSFSGKTEQYVGRLLHSADAKLLIDYRDKNIPYLDNQFKARQRAYKKLCGTL
jgi:superfamily II DNA or RNA helicase